MKSRGLPRIIRWHRPRRAEPGEPTCQNAGCDRTPTKRVTLHEVPVPLRNQLGAGVANVDVVVEMCTDHARASVASLESRKLPYTVEDA